MLPRSHGTGGDVVRSEGWRGIAKSKMDFAVPGKDFNLDAKGSS